MLLLLLRNGSCSGKFVAFKLSLLSYGAEKYIAVIDINVLFLRVFFIVCGSAVVSERFKVFYKLMKNRWKRSIAINDGITS